MSSRPRCPVLFVGHGAPTLAIDDDKGAPLRAWGASLPAPQAVLVLSAHWQTPRPTLGTSIPRPLIHDYSGFPPALREVTYPAPGAPQLSKRVLELLGDDGRVDPERGLDHGVWTPLVHLLPEATTPVLQLSLPRRPGPDLLALGARLRPLRGEGVWILGSGSLTHDLRSSGADGSPPPEDTRDFDSWVAERLRAGDHGALANPGAHRPDFRRHHPTTEHWDALLPVLGATDGDEALRFPVEGFEYQVLSRRAVEWGGS